MSDATTSETLKGRVIDVLKTVYDPEIPVDIYELGLIYEVAVAPQDAEAASPGDGAPESRQVSITMTLTSPMCPVAESLPIEVEEKVRALDWVDEVGLDLVWDPPWSPDMMSEAAKLELNM